ncbi:EF-hand domain-containing protein [Actinospica sp. MGRD01-02]|uniref:EF-hand domain-containing protein n=1 Tax=Actinospica acidithermotolerans TaxID=2828514 RepID=A0A941E692_9ACTN|nr:EF-hand domain-containing protein [Actinospica acidithermotolerans]MBR7827120.1 EF-hand domain-containing protein [Actinospica acidithermotolerans]
MLTALQRRKLQLRFALLDTDGNGYLSQRDYDLVTLRLCAAFGHLPGTPEYERVHHAYLELWEQLRGLMDSDGEGRISLSQFMDGCERLMREQPLPPAHDPVELIFEMVDADGNGVIDLSEFTKWMHSYGVGAQDTVEAFDLLDSDDDGVLSRPEVAAAAQAFYASNDPADVGNWLFGPL